MTISYNWLCDYLPVKPTPEELSTILTRIGLEVESLEKFEAVKGSLAGLVIGEVLTAEKHPNADKLRLTTVNTGNGEPLHIPAETVYVLPGASHVWMVEASVAGGTPLHLSAQSDAGELQTDLVVAGK